MRNNTAKFLRIFCLSIVLRLISIRKNGTTYLYLGKFQEGIFDTETNYLTKGQFRVVRLEGFDYGGIELDRGF